MTVKSISGAPRKFEQAELERREASYRAMYHNTLHCKELVHAQLPLLFIQAVIDKAEQGYVFDDKLPIKMEALHYQCYFIKPAHLQAEELEQLIGQVKDEYVAELEAEREKYKTLLKAQLIESDALKEQKKLDAQKAKRLAEIEAEVNNTFAELEIPE
jgi:hypothetical protein